MKKKLLKPPAGDGEVILIPDIKELISCLGSNAMVGVCHQPYFFNPGISLKLLFLKDYPAEKRKLIFSDTDKTKIRARVPLSDGSVRIVNFVDSEQALHDFPIPDKEVFDVFFAAVEEQVIKTFPHDEEGEITNLLRFKKILLDNPEKEYLKEILAESFLKYYGVETEYCFLSEMFSGEDFKSFFMKIYGNAGVFRGVFNDTLAEYRNEYKFRYKNYPFPALDDGELPFWIIEHGERRGCFEKDVEKDGFDGIKVFPRATTLTVFLRLFKTDVFVHDVGGGNYEWIQDRIIERFFGEKPPFYAILGGTFLLGELKQRDYPYFLYNPSRVKAMVEQIWEGIQE